MTEDVLLTLSLLLVAALTARLIAALTSVPEILVLLAMGAAFGPASVVALAVVLTLLLQALPATRLAARLGLLEPRTRTAAGSG